jgi:flagellar assembly protein FliH
MKPWPPEAIRFHQPLLEVRLISAAPGTGEIERRGQEWEQASYERGRLDGEKALSEQLVRQRSELLEIQNGVLESLRQAVPQVITDCQSLLVSLAIEVAHKLVTDLPITVDMIEAEVRAALAQAEESPEFNVFLHPDDLALLERANSSLAQINGGIHFHRSDDVSRGGCLVQTSFGVIDGRRETKLEALKKSLLS